MNYKKLSKDLPKLFLVGIASAYFFTTALHFFETSQKLNGGKSKSQIEEEIREVCENKVPFPNFCKFYQEYVSISGRNLAYWINEQDSDIINKYPTIDEKIQTLEKNCLKSN
jgi:hypothetical protein